MLCKNLLIQQPQRLEKLEKLVRDLPTREERHELTQQLLQQFDTDQQTYKRLSQIGARLCGGVSYAVDGICFHMSHLGKGLLVMETTVTEALHCAVLEERPLDPFEPRLPARFCGLEDAVWFCNEISTRLNRKEACSFTEKYSWGEYKQLNTEGFLPVCHHLRREGSLHHCCGCNCKKR